MNSSEYSGNILVVEEAGGFGESIRVMLGRLGYAVEMAADGTEGIARMAAPRRPSAVVLDLSTLHNDAPVVLKHIRSIDAEIPVIMIADAPSTLEVVEAMKNGATDFLMKPINAEALETSLAHQVKAGSCRPASVPPSEVIASMGRFSSKSGRMLELEAIVDELGRCETPVLIQGETGTGKEILARRLHAASPRADKVFLKLNCAALPSELVESELFGYERGAFTGAFQRKPGMFELADGGTLLLDEIGDMDVRLQAKLLQVLQDSEFQRIGGRTIHVDVRILAATHRNLEEAIYSGTFREDLYYRLNVISLELPPLRERPDDILPLAVYFLRKHAQPGRPVPVLGADLAEVILKHPWPGNIRELENAMRKLLILRDPVLLARDLRERVIRKAIAGGDRMLPEVEGAPATQSLTTLDELSQTRRAAESSAILQALEATRWNRKRAAELLQIDYKALLYKMKKLGLDDRPMHATA
jgi:two-component system, NtrC family, response regulator AtoC